jgi:hypothetical protein
MIVHEIEAVFYAACVVQVPGPISLHAIYKVQKFFFTRTQFRYSVSLL